MSSSLTSPLSNWRTTEGSASERRCQGGLNISTSIPQNPCLGWDFEERSNSCHHVQWNNEFHQVWRHPLSLSCILWGTSIQMATDSIRIMILSTLVNSFRFSFCRMASTGGRVQSKSPTWTLLKTFGAHWRHTFVTNISQEPSRAKDGIRAYWSKLTLELCSRYIDHLQKVMPIVVEEEGHPSGHWTIIFYEEQFIVCANVIAIVVTCTVLWCLVSWVTFDLFRYQTNIALLNKHCGESQP